MMRDNEFRSVLDECLERVRQGQPVDECLKAYPQHAEQLAPYLRSAATLRGLGAPAPAAASMQEARNTLLARVVEGGRERGVPMGIFKFGNVLAMAVAGLFVASVGVFAAAGGTDIFTGEDNTQSFDATVISTASTIFYVQTDANQYLFLHLTNETQYQDAAGHTIGRTDVHVRDHVNVRGTPAEPRFFNARVVRLIGNGPPPAAATPTDAPVVVEPTHAPEPAQEPTPAPTEKPVETPKPTEKPAATPKPTDKPVPPKPDVMEFWGVVTAVADGKVALSTPDYGNVIVYVNGDTQYPDGHPFVGVKVWIRGTKQGDGSVVASKVGFKLADFTGKVVGVNGGTFTVQVDGYPKTVLTNGNTSFPLGVPVVDQTVVVHAAKMGDGSYFAIEMKIKMDAPISFTGVILEHNAAEFTIKVDVSGTQKIVCFETATVQGTLAVGATVYVEVDHVESGTYFAGLVKVMS